MAGRRQRRQRGAIAAIVGLVVVAVLGLVVREVLSEPPQETDGRSRQQVVADYFESIKRPETFGRAWELLASEAREGWNGQEAEFRADLLSDGFLAVFPDLVEEGQGVFRAGNLTAVRSESGCRVWSGELRLRRVEGVTGGWRITQLPGPAEGPAGACRCDRVPWDAVPTDPTVPNLRPGEVTRRPLARIVSGVAITTTAPGAPLQPPPRGAELPGAYLNWMGNRAARRPVWTLDGRGLGEGAQFAMRLREPMAVGCVGIELGEDRQPLVTAVAVDVGAGEQELRLRDMDGLQWQRYDAGATRDVMLRIGDVVGLRSTMPELALQLWRVTS